MKTTGTSLINAKQSQLALYCTFGKGGSIKINPSTHWYMKQLSRTRTKITMKMRSLVGHRHDGEVLNRNARRHSLGSTQHPWHSGRIRSAASATRGSPQGCPSHIDSTRARCRRLERSHSGTGLSRERQGIHLPLEQESTTLAKQGPPQAPTTSWDTVTRSSSRGLRKGTPCTACTAQSTLKNRMQLKLPFRHYALLFIYCCPWIQQSSRTGCLTELSLGGQQGLCKSNQT